MSRRNSKTAMKVIPRFVYNPEKANRGLEAMADILVEALHRTAPHGQNSKKALG